MVVLFQRSGYDLTNPIEKAFGAEISFWLSIANDGIAGQNTGNTVTCTVYGRGEPDTLVVPYGTFLTRQVKGKIIEVPAKAGAFIEIIASEAKIDAAPQTITPTAVTVSGNVTASATIVNPVDGASGGVKVDIVAPLYKPGVVDTHDTGA